MFCVSFLSHILSALCACFIGLVLSQALGYVAAPLAEPKREHLANELVRQRDEVVQRGVRRADLAAVREAAEGQDLQPRRHDVRAPGTGRVYAVYLGFDRDEVGIGIERLTSRPECLRLISIFKRERAARPAAVRVWLLGQDSNRDADYRHLRPLPRLDLSEAKVSES